MKMRYMIFLNSLDIIKVIKVFTWNIFKLYELSNIIIFDYKSQFIMIFWKTLCTWFEINSWLLTVYHSETDNQTENINVIMKQYLWIYCSYLQDDWEKWFSLAEFIINNIINELTNVILFYIIYKQNS